MNLVKTSIAVRPIHLKFLVVITLNFLVGRAIGDESSVNPHPNSVVRKWFPSNA